MKINRGQAKQFVREGVSQLAPGHTICIAAEIFEAAFGIPASRAAVFLGDPRPMMPAIKEAEATFPGTVVEADRIKGIYQVTRTK